MSDVTVRHERDAHRFVAEVDGQEVTLAYRPVDDATVDFTSTFTPPGLRGRGLAHRVVTAALEWARGERMKVIPSCWYVGRVLEKEGEAE